MASLKEKQSTWLAKAGKANKMAGQHIFTARQCVWSSPELMQESVNAALTDMQASADCLRALLREIRDEMPKGGE